MLWGASKSRNRSIPWRGDTWAHFSMWFLWYKHIIGRHYDIMIIGLLWWSFLLYLIFFWGRTQTPQRLTLALVTGCPPHSDLDLPSIPKSMVLPTRWLYLIIFDIQYIFTYYPLTWLLVIEAPVIWQLAPLQFPEVSILTFPCPEITLWGTEGFGWGWYGMGWYGMG